MKVENQTLSNKEVRMRERRSKILAVASRFFIARGYDATSMTAIAEELGGSKATLWKYFHSKGDLLYGVVEEKISNFQLKVRDVDDHVDGLNAEFLIFFRGLISRLLSPEAVDLYRLVISENVRFPEIGKMFQERAAQPIQAMIAHFIDRRISEGALREVDRLRAVSVLASLCVSKQCEVLVGGRHPTPAQIDAEAEFLTDVFLRGFESR